MNTFTHSMSENRPASLKTAAKNHPLAVFAAFTFALAWLPVLLTGIVPFFVIALAAAAAPLAAFAVVTRLTAQETPAFSWRKVIPSGAHWYLFALIPVLLALIFTGLNLLSPDKVAYEIVPIFIMIAATIVLLAASEKFAWRGYVMPVLHDAHSWFIVRLVVLVWIALVYLPLYLVPAFAQPETPYLTRFPFAAAVVVLCAWLWHRAYVLSDGRPAPRLWRKILRVIRRGFMALPVMLFAIITTSVLYRAAAEAADYASLPVPGQMVSVGDHRLHLNCSGEGSPTVVLEAGNGAWSTDWTWVQAELAKMTRVCAYDRAGSGWSEPDPNPAERDANAMAEDLHTLLVNAGIPAPYIMAGHSMGGMYVRVFAAKYPQEVAGLVLVDPTLPDDGTLYGTDPAAMQAANDAIYDQFRVLVNMGLMRPYAFAPGLPEEEGRIRAALWMNSRSFEGTEIEVGALAHNMRLTIAAGSFGDLPLAVVLADHPEWDAGGETGANVKAAYANLPDLSTNSTFRKIAGSNHGSILWQQQYALELAAEILKVVQAAQTGQPLE